VFRGPNELFTENSWVQVMLGQGLMPEQHHPTADVMSDRDLAAFLGGIKTRIDHTVQQMPGHQQYVSRYAPGTQWQVPVPA